MAVVTYTPSGTKATTAAKLDKAVFGVVPENFEILKHTYLAYLANGRLNLAKTKTRGMVRGGGKKPWRQKGTGRARFGSSRVPIWRGGGITFGPTGLENYEVKVPTQIKRLAIRQALSLAAKEDKLSIIESLKPKNAKTSEMVKLFAKINLSGRILLVVDDKSPELLRSVANLQKVIVVQSRYINSYDAMNADHIIITSDALKEVHEWLGEKK
jgi:large subunit ribosomal protein L4